MTALPAVFTLRLDESVSISPDHRTLVGGRPVRRIRLTESGQRAFESIHAGRLETLDERRLARRLVDAGMAHPIPRDVVAPASVTVVIPTRDRPQMLARCLASIGRATPIVVVDDGSVDARPVERVCAARDAELVRLPESRGPAAARNAGFARVGTDVVAFVDSDCLIAPETFERLSRHFADPRVAAVAPRIVPFAARPRRLVASISAAYFDLDMGARPGLVGPSKRVPWVPSAVLLVRRSALLEAFDPSLLCGEDVDLVWRLHDSGWNVRYEPTVTVMHHEPEHYAALVRRRHRYGTSVGPLAKRHPCRLAQIHVGRWSAHPEAIARTTVKFAAPVLLAAASHRRTRLLAGALLAAPVLSAYGRQPAGSPARRAAVALHQLVDDLAYGTGVIRGCRSAKTWAPLIPHLEAPRA